MLDNFTFTVQLHHDGDLHNFEFQSVWDPSSENRDEAAERIRETFEGWLAELMDSLDEQGVFQSRTT